MRKVIVVGYGRHGTLMRNHMQAVLGDQVEVELVSEDEIHNMQDEKNIVCISGVGSCGAPSLQQIAREIETNCRDGGDSYFNAEATLPHLMNRRQYKNLVVKRGSRSMRIGKRRK